MSELKLSPLTRSYILFSDEVDFDASAEVGIIDDKTIERLVDKKQEIEGLRDTNIRAFLIFTGLSGLIASEFSIKTNFVSLDTGNVDILSFVLLCFSALSMLMISIHLMNAQVYDALISAAVKKRTKGDQVDPDVVKAQYEPTYLWMKLFRDNFHVTTDRYFYPKGIVWNILKFNFWLSNQFVSILWIGALGAGVLAAQFSIENQILKFVSIGLISISWVVSSISVLGMSWRMPIEEIGETDPTKAYGD